MALTKEPQARFFAACEEGRLGDVTALLADGRVDPRAENSEGLVKASARGHVQVVNALLADGRADPSKGMAIRMASYDGHAEVVRTLLADGRVNVHAIDLALRNASCTGHAKVIRTVLADGHGTRGVAMQYGRQFKRGAAVRVCVRFSAWFACAK